MVAFIFFFIAGAPMQPMGQHMPPPQMGYAPMGQPMMYGQPMYGQQPYGQPMMTPGMMLPRLPPPGAGMAPPLQHPAPPALGLDKKQLKAYVGASPKPDPPAGLSSVEHCDADSAPNTNSPFDRDATQGLYSSTDRVVFVLFCR